MATIDLRQLHDETFVFLFEGPPHQIAVRTLTETLTGFSSALEEINALPIRALRSKSMSWTSPRQHQSGAQQ